ncbi:MAG: ABC transporter permease [Cyclobacteriaceae bacterium]
MLSDQQKLPNWVVTFIEWICDPIWHDEVIGDLEELNEDLGNEWSRNWVLIYEVLRYLRPHLLKKRTKTTYTMMTINHVKISWRNLKRNKVYAFINILGLSVGLASVIMIGMYVQFETSYDKFFKDSDRIYRAALHRVYPGRTKDFGTSAFELAPTLKENYPVVEQATRLHRLFFNNEITVRPEGSENKFIETRFLFADSVFFDVFSYDFLHGDPKTALYGDQNVVLTASTALRYFGATDVVGRTIQLDSSLMVSGVIEDLPDNSHIHFDLLGSVDALPFIRNSGSNWMSPWVYTYIKLRENVNPSVLEGEFESIVDTYGNASLASTIGADWKLNGHAFEYYLQPLTDIHLKSKTDVEVEPNSDIAYVYVLTAIAIIILVISSINFINLSIARSTERAKEVGIRKVMGSYRKHLIGQFLTESVFVCLLSSVISIGILYAFIPRFNFLVGTSLDFNSLIDPLGVVLLLVFVVLIGIISGLYPAISISSMMPTRVLKGSFKTSSNGVWLRNSLITFQFLISIVMISGSIIADRQMSYLQDKNLGFNKDNLLIIKQAQNLDTDYQAFINELKSMSAVNSVGAASILPGQFHGSNVFQVSDPNIADIRTNTSNVDDEFISAMQMRLVEGRTFDPAFDDSLSIVVNEAAVRAMGVASGVGMKFKTSAFNGQGDGPTYKIVGVVEDYNYYSLHSEIGPMVMFNIQPDNITGNLVVRLNSTNVQSTLAALEAKWATFTEETFVYSFLDEELQQQYESDQNTARIFDIFTYLAIVMSCTGLFGLATYVVNQRSKEMSIRKVLGGSLFHIIQVFSREFLILIGVAFVIGVPLAYYALSEWLVNFAYHVDIGALSFIGAGLLTTVLVFITVSYQAIKIARVNPVKMLRSE